MDLKLKNMRISALLPTSLVVEMKEISERDGVTQSSIVKDALELWLTHKLERDAKALGKMKFDDLPSEEDWNIIQNEVLT